MVGMDKKDKKSYKQLAQGHPGPGSVTCPGLRRCELPGHYPAPDSSILIKHKGSTFSFVQQENFCLSLTVSITWFPRLHSL